MSQQSTEPQPAGSSNKVSNWGFKVLIIIGVLMMMTALVGLLNQFRQTSSPGAAQAPSTGPLRVGIPMPAFTLSDLDGKQVKLSDYAGRVVMINAWATWCPPCEAEMPSLNTFYQQHRDSGFVILAINAGETREQAATFVSKYGLAFPILLDPNLALMDQFAIQDYPTSILVGKDGKIKVKHIGYLSPEAIEREILPQIQ